MVTDAAYPLLAGLEELLAKKLITKRAHPDLPLFIYNYSASAAHLPMAEWPDTLRDCRGLILDERGAIVGRPFRKFWNYDQVLDQIPAGEDFTIWEKLDGSLGVVCQYAGKLVVSTRGSFESDQAIWATGYLDSHHSDFLPNPGSTYLFEVIYPSNRIVVDYGDRSELVLLSVLRHDATDAHDQFDHETRFRKAKQFSGLPALGDLSSVGELDEHAGNEGFVVRWSSGFRAKVKFEDYKRLHRLITQCSTRTIWELLRSGKDTSELISRVPQEFELWVRSKIFELEHGHDGLLGWANTTLTAAPQTADRKLFAEWAKKQIHPGLLFSLLDGKPIRDTCWKMVEPRWATPFKGEVE